MNYNNCNAVITGGASGLGGATADSIIKHGGKVTIIDIQNELGIKKAEELGSNCQYLNIDITNEDLVSESFTKILENKLNIEPVISSKEIVQIKNDLDEIQYCIIWDYVDFIYH